MKTTRYPEVEVELVGQNGNAFVILGLVSKALKKAGVAPEEVKKYREEATSGDYDFLLATTLNWVTVL